MVRQIYLCRCSSLIPLGFQENLLGLNDLSEGLDLSRRGRTGLNMTGSCVVEMKKEPLMMAVPLIFFYCF